MVFLSLARPTRRSEQQALEASAPQGFNYAREHVGATRLAPASPAPSGAGYVVDHNRTCVGSGPADFAHAQGVLEKWGHFQLGWATVEPSTPVTPGSNVCVSARTVLLWSRNPLQVVYTDRTQHANCRKRFAYAHGTLCGHLLAGEERFAVELRRDGSVWYDIYTFSRPGCLLARLCYPVARLQQRLFAQQSMAAVAAAVKRKGASG